MYLCQAFKRPRRFFFQNAARILLGPRSPLFRGVTDLFEDTGNPILKLNPSDPNVDILVPYDGHGLYAIYSTLAIPVLMQGCTDIDDKGGVKITVYGTPRFDVSTIDLASLRLLGAGLKDKKDAAKFSLRDSAPPERAN